MTVDGVQSETRYGPQPYEGILSVVCDAFHCAPDVAERQSWRTVKAILDYRLAEAAVRAFNDADAGMETMKQCPQFAQILAEMQRAAGDDGATEEAMRAEMSARGRESDSGE